MAVLRVGVRQSPRVYPEAAPDRCTAALLLDIDPVGLVRSRRGPAGESGTLEQYVNDRPYSSSGSRSLQRKWVTPD